MSKELIKVYFDSCCFIDIVSAKAGGLIEDDRSRTINIYNSYVKAALAKDIQIVTSGLTINECLWIKDPDTRKKICNSDVKELFRSILESGKSGVLSVEVDYWIRATARNLIWEHDINLKPIDSIHIATAIETQCEEFITSDEKTVLKYSDEIGKLGLRVSTAIKSKSLPEQYNQIELPTSLPITSTAKKEL